MIHPDSGYAGAVSFVEELLELGDSLIDGEAVQVHLWIRWRCRGHDVSVLPSTWCSIAYLFYESTREASKQQPVEAAQSEEYNLENL